jgi:hypothetical protein
MKNTILGLLLFCSMNLTAQTIPNFDLIKLEKISVDASVVGIMGDTKHSPTYYLIILRKNNK